MTTHNTSPSVTEAAFQAQVVELARLFGWKLHHTRPAMVAGRWMTPLTGDAGFPDLVLAHQDHGVVFAELKADRGRLSPGQRDWRTELELAGAEVYVWRPQDLDFIVRRLQGHDS